MPIGGLPLVTLLERHDTRCQHGSGGFTPYNDEKLQGQLAGGSKAMAVWRRRLRSLASRRGLPERVRAARQPIGMGKRAPASPWIMIATRNGVSSAS